MSNGENLDKKDSQVAKLQAKAAKLRAEAAVIEAEQQRSYTEALSQAFQLLDTNNDGSISLEELKVGLANMLKATVNESQAKKIMNIFDTSGDGKLQFEEFQGLDMIRIKFDKVLKEEQQAAADAEYQSRLASKAAEKAQIKAKLIQEMINNKPPSLSDKIVSLIPYLLPLVDALPYSTSYIFSNHLEQDPIFEFAATIFSFYRNVPFAGIVAFIIFNLFSANLSLNRLVRFNIQQAIFIDIALIIPGIASGIIGVASAQLGITIPPEISSLLSTGTFLIISSTIIYSVVCSLLGITPDKIPIISARVQQRVPTTEEFMEMFDEEGNFKTIDGDNKKKKNSNDDKDKKDKTDEK
eukprot:gene12471-16726_t